MRLSDSQQSRAKESARLVSKGVTDALNVTSMIADFFGDDAKEEMDFYIACLHEEISTPDLIFFSAIVSQLMTFKESKLTKEQKVAISCFLKEKGLD